MLYILLHAWVGLTESISIVISVLKIFTNLTTLLPFVPLNKPTAWHLLISVSKRLTADDIFGQYTHISVHIIDFVKLSF